MVRDLSCYIVLTQVPVLMVEYVPAQIMHHEKISIAPQKNPAHHEILTCRTILFASITLLKMPPGFLSSLLQCLLVVH